MIWDLRRFRPLWQAALLTLVLITLAQTMRDIPTADRYIWSRIDEQPVYRATRVDKAISLTFDTVWGTDYSQQILSVLKAHEVSATFFVSGWWLQKNPESMAAIIQNGHEIGNATQNYLHVRSLSEEKVTEELKTSHDLLTLAVGQQPTLLRPPFGENDLRLFHAANQLGYRTVMWTADADDWKNDNTEAISQRIIDNAQPGAIILLHTNASQTPQALEKAITTLKSQGYSFHTVSGLLQRKKPGVKGQ